jgi:signal transduction histidine kinase
MINAKRGSHLILLLVCGAGIILSLGVTFLTYRFEKEKVKDAFSDTAEYRLKYIKDALGDAQDALQSFGDFFASSQKVERAEFEVFSKGFLERRPYLFEFRWLPRVKADERQAFEEEARAGVMSSFTIKELDKTSRFIPAGQREEYYPVYYISAGRRSEAEYAQVLGLDAASFPERWQVMQAARDSNFPSATKETMQVGKPDISAVARIFLPIYRNGLPHNTLQERRDNLIGFVSLLYRMGELMEWALKGVPLAGVDILVYESSAQERQLLYFRPTRTRKVPVEAASAEQGARRHSDIALSDTFNFANQELLFLCAPAPEFLSKHKIILPWVILAIGLCTSFLFTLYLRAIIGRARQVEALVKQRTEELRKAKEELEIEAWNLSKANEGIKLLNNELERKNEVLKKFDQLKSDFVSVVSHELRTPLSIMKEGVSLVLDKITGDISEKTRRTLDMVFANINRLNKIITDLLDISKIEAGRMQLRKTFVEINSLIRDTAEKWRLETDKKRQQLDILTGEVPLNIYLDPDKIIQVLSNLLSNAVKFTPQGGKIKVEVVDKGEYVEIAVSDSGVGIDKESLPKVFEKFQQFQRPDGSGGKGTGLGLAICKELVSLHEGSIRVESQPGAGAKFSFTLPKKDSEAVFKEHTNSAIQ